MAIGIGPPLLDFWRLWVLALVEFWGNLALLMAPTGADSLLTTISIPCGPMTEVAAAGKPRSRILRAIYFGLGLICMGFVYMSWLPGIPTFDFVILAAFFFSRSSDRFHHWITNHPVFGKVIRGYRTDGLTTRAKIVASVAMGASLGFSAIFLIDNSMIRTVLGLVGLYALWFIWTRKAPAASPAIDAPPTGT